MCAYVWVQVKATLTGDFGDEKKSGQLNRFFGKGLRREKCKKVFETIKLDLEYSALKCV